MTCEVAVANKLAIALAADSAVTFSGSSSQTTYASGANKIFQLAKSEPVAVMIYNNADLVKVPWELIIKAYRSQQSTEPHSRLGGYVDGLVEFINNCSTDLIPPELKESSSMETYRSAVIRVINMITSLHPIVLDPQADPNEIRQTWSDAFDGVSKWVESFGVHESLDAAEMQADIGRCSAALSAEIAHYLANEASLISVGPFVDTGRLAELAVSMAFRKGHELAGDNYTGVVIAGFGKDDYMPGFADTKFFGFIGGRVLHRRDAKQVVNYNGTSSIIEAFARRAMVETFTQGASPEVWTAVGNAFSEYAVKVCKAASADAGVDVSDEHIKVALDAHMDQFTNAWTRSVFADHLRPLWRVVASLSVSELAELAETLVQLESLKEKVTQRTQSVGGPIDVAVITKAEGLVWIKRKLYFDSKLNYRYFRRIDTEESIRHE